MKPWIQGCSVGFARSDFCAASNPQNPWVPTVNLGLCCLDATDAVGGEDRFLWITI